MQNKYIIEHYISLLPSALISNSYRLLSQWGVKIASEKAIRQIARHWTIDSIGVDMMPFTFPVKDGQEVPSAP